MYGVRSSLFQLINVRAVAVSTVNDLCESGDRKWEDFCKKKTVHTQDCDEEEETQKGLTDIHQVHACMHKYTRNIKSKHDEYYICRCMHAQIVCACEFVSLCVFVIVSQGLLNSCKEMLRSHPSSQACKPSSPPSSPECQVAFCKKILAIDGQR